MKMNLIYIIGVLLLGCKNHNENTIILQYDFYQHDSLKKNNALIIEYKRMDVDSFQMVKITSRIESMQIVFKEKINEIGIYRSIDSSDFYLTHSFVIGKATESSLPKSYPVFLNTSSKGIKEKRYPSSNNDSISIIFFDENIPFYTFTSSYYSKKLGFFLIYYNQRQDSYFKLSKAQGLQEDAKDILKVTDKLSHDTLFFGRYYKLPSVLPPPLKE